MFALKNELLSVLPKATDAKTYLSNMDKIVMILTLIKLGIEFDNIREQILTSFAIMTFGCQLVFRVFLIFLVTVCDSVASTGVLRFVGTNSIRV